MNTPTHFGANQSELAPGTKQPTILIVENEVSNLILIQRVLSTRGYHCVSASNGLEALNILDHEQVDLILTDLSMPVLDGYRTTQLIRARPALEVARHDVVGIVGNLGEETLHLRRRPEASIAQQVDLRRGRDTSIDNQGSKCH